MNFCIGSRVSGRCLLVTSIAAICFATASASAAEPFSGAMRAGEERAYSALKMKFCHCPAGKFTMGSPADEAGPRENEDQVDVTLTQRYWLGKYEVTQGQWKAVMSIFRCAHRRINLEIRIELQDIDAVTRRIHYLLNARLQNQAMIQEARSSQARRK